jgi:hypothetical protein
MWKNIVQPGRPQTTTWRMRMMCWIPKSTNIHSRYMIIIVFPLQQWLHERASLLRTLPFLYSPNTTQVILFKIILFLFSLVNYVTPPPKKKKLFLSRNNIGVALEPLHLPRYAYDYDLQSRGDAFRILPDQRLSRLLIKAILLIHSGQILGHYWTLKAFCHIIFSSLHAY